MAAKKSDALNRMLAADAQHESAAKALCAATAAAFPVGTRLVVTLGRSRVTGRVTGVSDAWWAEPCAVWIENEATGKRRKFNPVFHSGSLTVIHEPEAK